MKSRNAACLLLVTMLIIMSASAADNSFQDYLKQLGDQKAKVRMTAVWALGKSGDGRAVEPLIQRLGDEDKDVRQWTVLALSRLGQPAIDPLISVLADNRSAMRWQAAAALGLAGDSRAVPSLISAMADGSNETRCWAAIALGQINDSSSREPLIMALGDTDPAVRRAAGWSLRRVEGARALDLFISTLEDESSSIRVGAATALGDCNDTRVLQPLIYALADPDAGVRASAASSLGRLNDISSLATLVQVSSIARLVQMLGDDSPIVRGEAKSSLTRMGKEAAGALIESLQRDDELSRAEAAEVLGDLGQAQAVDPLIQAFRTGDGRLRHNAVLSLIELNKTAGFETFLELLNSENSELRADAAWALGLSGDVRARERLLQSMAGDEDADVRLNASKALRELGRKWQPVALAF